MNIHQITQVDREALLRMRSPVVLIGSDTPIGPIVEMLNRLLTLVPGLPDMPVERNGFLANRPDEFFIIERGAGWDSLYPIKFNPQPFRWASVDDPRQGTVCMSCGNPIGERSEWLFEQGGEGLLLCADCFKRAAANREVTPIEAKNIPQVLGAIVETGARRGRMLRHNYVKARWENYGVQVFDPRSPITLHSVDEWPTPLMYVGRNKWRRKPRGVRPGFWYHTKRRGVHGITHRQRGRLPVAAKVIVKMMEATQHPQDWQAGLRMLCLLVKGRAGDVGGCGYGQPMEVYAVLPAVPSGDNLPRHE